MIQRILPLLAAFGLLLGSTICQVSGQEKNPEKGTANIAHIRLGGNLDETPVSADPLFGTSAENFKTKIERIHKAMEDKSVQALLIQVDDVKLGWAKAEELRKAIAEFRKTGRKAYAYFDSGMARDYLVASACDVICIPESGWVVLVGIRAEISFYKELLEKLGIRAEFLQMGVFKAAAEPFTRTKMSPEAKAQLKLVLDDFFDNCLVRTISQSRSKKQKELSPQSVAKIIDEGPFTARRAVELGLVDQLAYFEDMEGLIKKDLGNVPVKVIKNYASEKPQDIDFSNPFAFFKLLMPPKSTFRPNKDRIALIYAVGPIIHGKGGSSLFDVDMVGSTTMVEAIRQAEKDPKVKAIVLRVDSPGGSALASDLIWRELKRCKKPVIASMSDVAASGGYYISMGARKIFAQPGTLTGSIGVVGGKFALGGLYEKIGINTEVLSRGANAGIFGTTHPFTKSEREAMEKLMVDIYDQFLNKAIEGRGQAGKKFSRDDMIKLAEGRIWTGRQALEKGLVDALGSLEDAIAEAKVQAGLAKDADTDYLILPKARSFMETLMEKSGDAQTILPRNLARLGDLQNHLHTIDALLQLRSEPVWLMMPHGLEVK